MKLPIQLVRGTYPPRFQWQQVLDTAGGTQVVDHDGYLPATVDTAVASLVTTAERLVRERDNLQAFQDWVHSDLDARGVPHHPPGTHGAEGCRVGDRMDWVFAELAQARAPLPTAETPEVPAPRPAAPAPVAAIPSRRGGKA